MTSVLGLHLGQSPGLVRFLGDGTPAAAGRACPEPGFKSSPSARQTRPAGLDGPGQSLAGVRPSRGRRWAEFQVDGQAQHVTVEPQAAIQAARAAGGLPGRQDAWGGYALWPHGARQRCGGAR